MYSLPVHWYSSIVDITPRKICSPSPLLTTQIQAISHLASYCSLYVLLYTIVLDNWCEDCQLCCCCCIELLWQLTIYQILPTYAYCTRSYMECQHSNSAQQSVPPNCLPKIQGRYRLRCASVVGIVSFRMWQKYKKEDGGSLSGTFAYTPRYLVCCFFWAHTRKGHHFFLHKNVE